jgi:alpha/beta superfamily hydrolase
VGHDVEHHLVAVGEPHALGAHLHLEAALHYLRGARRFRHGGRVASAWGGGRVGAKQEQKMVTIALDGAGAIALEGLFASGAGEGRGGAVVAPPHPLYGGSMDSPVVNELCFAFRAAGRASLCFNWRGVGASGGEPSGEAADADADYAAALRQLAETVAGPLAACGYSFGAAAALRVGARAPRVEELLLVAPPPALIEAAALRGFRGRVLAIAGERDAMARPAELERLVAGLPRGELAVVPEADHFFVQGLAAVGRAAARWLEAS